MLMKYRPTSFHFSSLFCAFQILIFLTKLDVFGNPASSRSIFPAASTIFSVARVDFMSLYRILVILALFRILLLLLLYLLR